MSRCSYSISNLKGQTKMKEYKVIITRLGFTKREHKLEGLLNQYAREGWVVNHVAQGWGSIIFERDKNR